MASLFAQNNQFKIKDELYPIYRRAFLNRATELGVQTADTLARMAVALGDKKAECLAYTIYLQHNSIKNDGKALQHSVTELQRVAKRNGYQQYYYYGSSLYITYLLNTGQSILAMQENAKVEKEAFAEHSHYGIYTCLNNMAKIQTGRANFTLSVEYRKQALNYMLEYLPEQDPTQLYLEISEYYRAAERNYDKALELNRKASKTAKNVTMKARVYIQRCLIYFSMNSYDDFNRCFKEFESYQEHVRFPDTDANYNRLMIYRAIVDRDYEKALQLADISPREDGRLQLKSDVYELMGDYENAYRSYVASRRIRDSIVNTVQISDIAEMNSQVGNQILQNELNRRESEAMALKLKQAEQQVEMEQQKSLNEQLQMHNQKLELDKLKSDKRLLDAENEKQRVTIEKELTKSEYQRRTIIIGALSAFIILFGLLIALARHRMMLNNLAQKNKELEVARDQANQANKMKSEFIHNMSHEIRTPLNSIVGFSQLLTTPGMDFSEEEQQEYSQLIQHNSEMLTTLVNDLLGLAELESGKYTVNKTAVDCNEICGEAISTVMHRKPVGVDLRYTTDLPAGTTIFTDGRRVKQVLINYLTNAEKHTKQGFIELRCSRNENPGMLTFSVTDTGTGIAPENVEKVFERFEKLNHFEPGFGLGLSICSAIAARLDGKVKLDTTYTDGARFVFIIPLELPPVA